MKKEKQKTAVELFAQRLIQRGIGYNINDFEEAKEMFEKQIQDAYRINPNNELWSNSGIDYYNETFKQQEQ
jgi:endonuclease III-like uncharacterized protein